MHTNDANDVQMTSSTLSPPPNWRGRRRGGGMKALFAIFLVFLVMGLAIAVFIIGIYRFGWQGSLVRQFVQLVPLPAAVVSGRIIYLDEVYEQVGAYQKVVAGGSDYNFNSKKGMSWLEDQSRSVLEKLIEKKIIADICSSLGLSATEPEVSRYYRYLLHQFNFAEEKQAQDQIKNLFGWDKDKFKKALVYPDLLKAKLQIYVLTQAIKSKSYLKIKFVAEQVASGLDFAKAAVLYSEDQESKHLGGDLGFYSRDELPFWFSDVVFNLENNQVSEIVVSPEGYHLFQVTAKDERSNPGRVQIRQVFLEGPPFSEFLDKQKENYQIYIFGKM